MFRPPVAPIQVFHCFRALIPLARIHITTFGLTSARAYKLRSQKHIDMETRKLLAPTTTATIIKAIRDI